MSDRLVKLDIGSSSPQWQQKPADEWLHLDVSPWEHVEIVADFGDIPLPDNSVDEIFIGDVIEHVPQWRCGEVLGEWARILKPGGIIRGRCPNIDRVMRDYADNKLSLHDAMAALYGGCDCPGQQHYWGYTKDALTELFANHGITLDDFSKSPGPHERPWWLVFNGRRDNDQA